jgi:hypothetical protein
MAKGKTAASKPLVELRCNAKFKSFIPRFQVNGDKLLLVFEMDWNHLPDGFLGKVQDGARGFGELIWKETLAAPDGDGEDPTQGKLGI